MVTFILRTATPNDKDAVSELLVASYSVLLRPDYAPELLAVALPIMATANPALLASGTYFVAETESGELIGCGGWTMNQPGTDALEDGVAHVRHFATDPRWLRRGVGRAILQRSLSEAAAAGVRRVECYATLSAEKFYASNGFQVIRSIRVPLAGGVDFPALLMHRALDQPTALTRNR